MADEMRDHKYVPAGSRNRVFVEQFIKAAALTLDTAVYSDVAPAAGYGRQGYKVVFDDTGNGTPTTGHGDVEIQELIQGLWVSKGALGVGTANPGVLFEYNSEDSITTAVRVKVTPKVELPFAGIRITINGRLDF